MESLAPGSPGCGAFTQKAEQIAMNNEEQQSAAVRKANLHFRKETQLREGAAAWSEYNAQEAAMRQKTARLREQRLARDALAEKIIASSK